MTNHSDSKSTTAERRAAPRSEPTNELSAVWVIIPALNEEKSLPLVLKSLPSVGRAIVVDNGSTDRTAQIAADLGATVVAEPVRGYGIACLRGIQAVRDAIATSHEQPAAIVFLDADFSDSPEILPTLVEPIFLRRADLVIGSRVLGEREAGAMPMHSFWGTRFACWLIAKRFNIPCTDLGPFRAIRWTALDSLDMTDRGFGWTIEMQVNAARNRLRIVELPVPYRRRVGESKISGTFWGSLQASAKILWMLARHVIFIRKPRRESAMENHAVAAHEALNRRLLGVDGETHETN